jgi:branched-chain amino acid transport system ATP-binding protein
LRTERGTVTKGTITLNGKRIDRMPAFDVTKLGISQVFEGRLLFEHLTTEENLVAGTHLHRDAAKVRSGIERVYAYFPALKNRRAQLSGYLSGGEQQMLPKVILLDEPSLGLAPMLVEEIFGIVRRLVSEEKLAVLLVEQNATMALHVADHGYVMENGRIVPGGQCRAAAFELRPS